LLPEVISNSPWYAVLLIAAGALALTSWLYVRNRKNTECPKSALRLLFAVRLVSLFITGLLLLELLLKQSENVTEDPVVLVAVDNSASMIAGTDSALVRTELPQAIDRIIDEVGGKFSVRVLQFGSEVKTTEETPAFTDKETDIENLLASIENNYSNQNIGALIIASDGIYNRGASPAQDAVKLGYPVYTIATGDTVEKRDLILRKVEHNQLAYLGNVFPAEVILSAKKYQGSEARVDILQGGRRLSSQTVRITSDNFLAPIQFTLNAETRGVVRYTASITPLDGEANRVNNEQSFVIEVIDNKDKILLLANAPHPDVAAIKEIIQNGSSYEAETAFAHEFRKPLKQYNLVIIHGYNHARQAALLDECNSAGIPYWIVNPTSPDKLPGIRITGTMGRFNDAEPFFDRSFGLFAVSDQLAGFAGTLPAVKTFFGSYAVGGGTGALIKQRIGVVETDQPILAFSELNGLKSAVFAGDGLWKWKLRDYAEHGNYNLFAELIGKTLQYLVVKADKSFFRVSAPRIADENEAVELQAEVYNKSYELITTPDVALTLVNPQNKKFSYTFSKTAKDYRLNLGILPAGEYRYEARVTVNGESFIRQGQLNIREIVAERLNTVANHQLLFQLASRSGGALVSLAEAGALPGMILKNEQLKPVTYTSVSTKPLIGLWWLFPVIVLALATEWYFRKRYLSI
jgi:hypothetical protein